MYRTPEERFAGLPDFPFEPHYVELEGLRPALRCRFRCVAVGHALAALIPGSRFSLICCAGHFLQEEKGLEIAQEILAFVPD